MGRPNRNSHDRSLRESVSYRRRSKVENSPYERLAALGITLPPPPPPIANFVTHVLEGNMLYLSGQGPREADGFMHA